MPGRYIALVTVILFASLGLRAQVERLDGSVISARELDAGISRLMKAAEVHGLGIGIFNNGKPVYQKTFGYKQDPLRQPLLPTTNIYGASLSKAVFAVLVMRLVEEGTLELDKPLQDYLPRPIYEYKPVTKWQDHYEDLRQDSLYRRITARMCLAHSTGFANWRWDEPDQKLRIHDMPGTRYSYSGEGMVYLQTVIERMLNRSLESLMQEKIFGPLGMRQSSYSWKPAYEADYAWGHDAGGKPYDKDKDNEPRAASTLETTLNDYCLFTQAVLENKLLAPSSTSQMFTPQMRLRSLQQFGPLRHRDSSLNDAIGLSSGLGWILLRSPYGTGALKEGHGDGFQHYTILFPSQGKGIVIMTNSDNGESIFRELLQLAIADHYTPWYWENYIPYDQKRN